MPESMKQRSVLRKKHPYSLGFDYELSRLQSLYSAAPSREAQGMRASQFDLAQAQQENVYAQALTRQRAEFQSQQTQAQVPVQEQVLAQAQYQQQAQTQYQPPTQYKQPTPGFGNELYGGGIPFDLWRNPPYDPTLVRTLSPDDPSLQRTAFEPTQPTGGVSYTLPSGPDTPAAGGGASVYNPYTGTYMTQDEYDIYMQSFKSGMSGSGTSGAD